MILQWYNSKHDNHDNSNMIPTSNGKHQDGMWFEPVANIVLKYRQMGSA